MDVIISHESALEYWRLHGSANIDTAARLRRKTLPTSLPDIFDIRAKIPPDLSYPINLMVNSPNARRRSKTIRPHVCTASIPDWSFTNIGGGIAVSTPAFCYFQMAGELPPIKLIELGYELCGSYSLAAVNEYTPGLEAADKTSYGHPPLTNTKALRNFAARMEGVNGQKNAHRALRYVADRSASPMETILVMLLTLPNKLGGCGLPVPELNKRIDMGKGVLKKSDKSYYVCDLFWPEANLAVEYDSDFYHTGANRIANDSKKRLDLAVLGIDVITVTRRQVRNALEFENLARLIARTLGKRLRYGMPQLLKAQHELRSLLL
ncbi:MAG: hypothetical protein FWF33_06945 [Clostridiales bacterium]|nr:hypothetical protein [Clostridiales bacterium]